ncbi:MAG: hypothetical protein ISS41_00875 [Candidatus Aminicenantes bacterium]|nr:hypothetical protein [Candidatus Aminicenantes bacterium]MBL7082164.1 hypothetical protein [Candidatus Aminicenantes bacterium]
MKQKNLLSILLFLLIAQCYVAVGQFTPAEIAQREKLEEFLKTAEIIKSEDIGEGVTKPIKLTLKKGDVERYGAWKNPKGIKSGQLEGWQYEIAAYEMDKLLGLNMVPPTVERELHGLRGSLQLWVESQLSDLELREKGMSIPDSELLQWSKMKYLARAFDSLIANDDRTQQNVRYTKDWRTILIDHSRSFRSSGKFMKRLVFGKKGIKGVTLIRYVPRAFIEKVKALNFDTIRNAVGPYLKDKEIEAVLKRKELLLKEIEEMIKEYGEKKVLY